MRQSRTRWFLQLARGRGRAALILLLAALVGCAAPIAEPPALDTTARFERPALAELPDRPSLRIGINTEITGTGAAIGDLGVRAARLAVEEINAAGGVNGAPIELVVRDCRSDPQVALEQYRLALRDDHLAALIGPFKSAYAVRIVPEHRAASLPMLIGATNAGLTAQGDTNLFRMRPSDKLTSAAMTALAVDELGRRRVAIIHDSDAFGSGGADGITAMLAERGLSPAARESYPTGTRDFDALVRRVAVVQPDAVLVYGTNNTDVGLLLRALRYWQVDAAIVTSPGGATAVTHSIAAEAQDGVYVAMDAAFGATPPGARFERRFTERFGLPPDTYVAWYYDAIYLLAAALAQNPAGPEDLSAALRGLPFTGVQGAYAFDSAGEGLHRVILARMAGGVASPVGQYSADGFTTENLVSQQQPAGSQAIHAGPANELQIAQAAGGGRRGPGADPWKQPSPPVRRSQLQIAIGTQNRPPPPAPPNDAHIALEARP